MQKFFLSTLYNEYIDYIKKLEKLGFNYRVISLIDNTILQKLHQYIVAIFY
jgi:hypothetical protein